MDKKIDEYDLVNPLDQLTKIRNEIKKLDNELLTIQHNVKSTYIATDFLRKTECQAIPSPLVFRCKNGTDPGMIYVRSEFIMNMNLKNETEILLLVHGHQLNDEGEYSEEPWSAAIRFSSPNPDLKEIFDNYEFVEYQKAKGKKQ